MTGRYAVVMNLYLISIIVSALAVGVGLSAQRIAAEDGCAQVRGVFSGGVCYTHHSVHTGHSTDLR